MTQEDLDKVLELHKKWLSNEEGGERANLSEVNLSWKNLVGANLRGANLRGADLRWAKLVGSNLRWANLVGANLSGAYLENIKANESTSGYWPVCPEEGSFVGWKKCMNNVIVKLLIPDDAQRSSATSRKCRCSKAVVLDVFGADEGFSTMDEGFIYKKGATVLPDRFDDDRWNECSGGIHFFMSRKEAECYNTL
jgi:Uncharacterized low-complexity proteins